MKFLTTSEFKETVFDFKNSKNWNYKGEKPLLYNSPPIGVVLVE
jgi:hypothetical protein